MINSDPKEVDNINNKIKFVNIDEVSKTIVKNEDIIDIEKVISIDNKEEMEIRPNGEEVSNTNIKSIAMKIVDKENISDDVEIEKASKIAVKKILEPLTIKIRISFVVYRILLTLRS